MRRCVGFKVGEISIEQTYKYKAAPEINKTEDKRLEAVVKGTKASWFSKSDANPLV